ncbi:MULTISPECIES: HI1506-related protein [Methylococcus]|uniref:HI1506-related protein n=1 Tax=Methylococcus capsulatus TaxID=414 RepID=A0ABZ2F9H5_METCP|nr:HI1506-related protein [Methylococcus sp. BF19-07]
MIIRITARRAGFRRCGIAHPAEPTDYPFDRFSESELKTLQAENMLIVEVLDDGASGSAAADPAPLKAHRGKAAPTAGSASVGAAPPRSRADAAGDPPEGVA